jgi:ribosomal protein S18 acetylase RimI-like enzyme
LRKKAQRAFFNCHEKSLKWQVTIGVFVNIRPSVAEDSEGIMNVAKTLHPGWFDRIAINESIPRDIKLHPGYVAERSDGIIGFIVYSLENERGQIKWIGVRLELHRQGIGTELHRAMEEKLNRTGIKEIRVETVAEETEYEPYERTRAFYEKMGFRVEKVARTKSEDTGEEFYMATYMKKLPLNPREEEP